MMSEIKQVEFTKQMKQTHTILVPMMLPIHFVFLKQILRGEGYQVEILQNEDQSVIDTGLRYVHNDTCYPALLVIGQMIDALKSGRYDLDHVALAITQTGGGCRASNYIHLLRKALVQANMAHIPVISVNFSHLEQHSGFHITPKLLVRLAAGFLYADVLMWLSNQVKPYELTSGTCDQCTQEWIDTLVKQFDSMQFTRIKRNVTEIVHSYAAIPRTITDKIKVGIVGEIYMKYAPLGNRNLERFLLKEGCEPVVSGVLNFALYCLENVKTDYAYYDRNKKAAKPAKWGSHYIQKLQRLIIEVIEKDGHFRAPAPFDQVMIAAEQIIDRGVKMGEGWLLSGEMAELIQSGVNNIVCCQPFGCLPNHIVAKGMMRKLKNRYPNANIVAVDYDPGATDVNQENRLKLMLANAHLQEAQNHQEDVSQSVSG